MKLLKRTFLLLLLLSFTGKVMAQSHTDQFVSGATTLTFEGGKKNDLYFLVVKPKDTIKAKKEEEVQAFYYGNVKARLNKQFQSSFANNPLLPAHIENFASQFGATVAQKVIVKPADPEGTYELTKTKKLGKLELQEYHINKKEYAYALVIPADPKNKVIGVLSKKDGVYKYDDAVLTANDVFKDSLLAIAAVIKEYKNVNAPQVSLIKINGQHKIYLENSDGSTNDVNITATQATALAKALEKSKAPAESKEEPAPAKPENSTADKKPESILDIQLANCTAKEGFNISVLTYPKDADSIQLVLNTAAEKKSDILHKEIGAIEFKRLVSSYEGIKKMKCDSATLQSSLDVVYGKLEVALKAKKKEEERKELEEKTKKQVDEVRQELNTRIDQIAGERDYAAVIDLAADSIYLHPGKKAKCGSRQTQDKSQQKFLHIDSVSVRISNNVFHQIDIVGTIDGKRVQTSSNNGYGLNLRKFIDGGGSITFPYEGLNYTICYKELFFIRPTSENAITYNLRDGEVLFVPAKGIRQQKLEQKRLLDFMSASVLLDLQAFNANNPNKNLLGELYFNFDINSAGFRYFKRATFFRHTYTNLSLATNLFKEANALPTYRKTNLIFRDSSKIDTATVPPFYKYDSIYSNTYYLKNFDLIKYSFFQIRPVLNLISFDIKPWNTFIDINTGVLFMGSNARIIDPSKGNDSVSSVPVFSYSGMMELRWRVNPKPRYGIDFHFIHVPGLKLIDDSYKSITGPYTVEQLVKSQNIDKDEKAFYQGELGFYFNPKKEVSNTDRGGIYFKVNWYKKYSGNDGHVMFLAGYSTDIKNFFK